MDLWCRESIYLEKTPSFFSLSKRAREDKPQSKFPSVGCLALLETPFCLQPNLSALWSEGTYPFRLLYTQASHLDATKIASRSLGMTKGLILPLMPLPFLPSVSEMIRQYQQFQRQTDTQIQRLEAEKQNLQEQLGIYTNVWPYRRWHRRAVAVQGCCLRTRKE